MHLAHSTKSPSWASEATERRIDQLIGQMTLDDKIAYVTGHVNYDYAFYVPGNERLGLPRLQMADGPAGVRVNKGDVNEGKATALPAPIALAATWDPSLAYEYGAVVAVEALATDHNVSLGPAIDISRVPLAGRTFESYGEDPRLTAAIGVEYVRGVQAQGIQACAKHFAMNNQEYQRSSIDARVDERAIREIYLPPFEALISDGEVASVMGAFNRVNGTFSCENPMLMRELLRDAFGFRGWVMSDYAANHSTAAAANAGLDQEQPGEGYWGAQLWHAVQSGDVSEATLDEKVGNILRPLIGLGQLDSSLGVEPFAEDEHHAIAQRIAEASMVLLRNDGVLPLTGVRTLALIGTDVEDVSAQGGGSSQVRPTREVSPLEGLRRALGDDVEITVAYGCEPVTPGVLLPGPPIIPRGFFTAPDGEPGLRAEWWENTDHAGDPVVSRTDSLIEHNLGAHNFPGFNAGSARFEKLPGELNGRTSARWTGALTVPVTGTYRFTVTAVGSFAFELGDRMIASSDTTPTSGADLRAEAATVAVLDDEDVPETPEPEATQPYDWGSSGAADAPMYDVAVRLVAGKRYGFRFSYQANDPIQGNLIGARVRLGWVPPVGVVSPSATAAAELAAASDAAVVIVRTYEAESDDRPSMHLPSGQDELIRTVLAANPRTIVVLMSGAPVDMNAWGREPNAVLQAWFPGQAQGDALARVLTGQVEPGGRLPITFPRDLAQTPAADPHTYPGVDGQVEYREGVFVGYRGVTEGAQPAYPFGHGLGYTAFAYEGLDITQSDEDPVATVSVTVRNIGDRPGTEVVQVYVGELPTSVPTPPRQLAAFVKVRLEPGDSTRVHLRVPRRAVSYFDVTAHDWATPSGEVDIFVGSSSSDVRESGRITV